MIDIPQVLKFEGEGIGAKYTATKEAYQEQINGPLSNYRDSALKNKIISQADFDRYYEADPKALLTMLKAQVSRASLAGLEIAAKHGGSRVCSDLEKGALKLTIYPDRKSALARYGPRVQTGKNYHTITFPKALLSKYRKAPQPSPAALFTRLINFVWKMLGLPGFPPALFTRIVNAYFRSLVGFTLLDKLDFQGYALMFQTLGNTHPTLIGAFEAYYYKTLGIRRTMAKQIAANKLARASIEKQLKSLEIKDVMQLLKLGLGSLPAMVPQSTDLMTYTGNDFGKMTQGGRTTRDYNALDEDSKPMYRKVTVRPEGGI